MAASQDARACDLEGFTVNTRDLEIGGSKRGAAIVDHRTRGA